MQEQRYKDQNMRSLKKCHSGIFPFYSCILACLSRAGGNPVEPDNIIFFFFHFCFLFYLLLVWIPAYAGMTKPVLVPPQRGHSVIRDGGRAIPNETYAIKMGKED
jgi:hypothetical protein